MARCSGVKGQGSNHQEPKQPRAAAAPVDPRERDERGSEDGEEGAQMRIEGEKGAEQEERRSAAFLHLQVKSPDCAQSNADKIFFFFFNNLFCLYFGLQHIIRLHT